MTSASEAGYLCWQKIGISGDRACEHLSRYVHCRNCPEYSAGGRTLFDREIPADLRREISEELATAAAAAVEPMESVLVLRLGAEWFALRTHAFQEVSAHQKAYLLPFRSGTLLDGLVNVNGELLLCVSLPAVLGLSPEEKPAPAGRPRLCVIRNGSERFAFGVDEILGVRRIPRARLEPVPVTLAKSPSALITACFEIDGRNAGLVDEQRLFNSLDRSLRW